MLVRHVDDLAGTDREVALAVAGKTLRSVGVLTLDDGCGFSLSDVRVAGGWSCDLHHTAHVGVTLVVAGQLEVKDLTHGASQRLDPGMLYVAGPNDRHRVTVAGDARLVCLFNPALTGSETPDAGGAFAATGELPPAWRGNTARGMFVLGEAQARRSVLQGDRPPPWRSATSGTVRMSHYLSPDDGCGLTVSLPRGTADSMLWYKNHVEANYVLEGEATVEDLASRQVWALRPGSLYVVGPRDRHHLKAEREVYFISVFNPPLEGDAARDADGAYPPTGEVPPAWRA